MIYAKTSSPLPQQNRYAPRFEYMFVFSKGKPKTANIQKEPCKQTGRLKTARTIRNVDGSQRGIKDGYVQKTKSMGNVWTFDIGYMHSTKDKIAFQHPAIFPEALAERHIISWSNPGDMVFDPFTGSGTTAVMAAKNERNFIGTEIDNTYLNIAKQRIENYLAAADNADGFLFTVNKENYEED